MVMRPFAKLFLTLASLAAIPFLSLPSLPLFLLLPFPCPSRHLPLISIQGIWCALKTHLGLCFQPKDLVVTTALILDYNDSKNDGWG